jgi:hypothetical protein
MKAGNASIPMLSRSPGETSRRWPFRGVSKHMATIDDHAVARSLGLDKIYRVKAGVLVHRCPSRLNDVDRRCISINWVSLAVSLDEEDTHRSVPQ